MLLPIVSTLCRLFNYCLPFPQRFRVAIEDVMEDDFSNKEVNNIFLNDDIAIEILSRLPIGSINALKCVSKRWHGICSHPAFSNAHFQRSQKTISGIFLQGTHYCICCENYIDYKGIDYISIVKDGKHSTTKKVLDFLPEKVVVLSSCDGVLLCRSIFKEYDPQHPRSLKDNPKEVMLYVCNPFTKEWTSLKPKGKYGNGCCYGFSYNGVGSSFSPNIQVVLVQPPLQRGIDPYVFTIYSSKTGKWKTSQEVCFLPDRLVLRQTCFASGVFYWLTTGHSILAFNLKEERSHVIKLPGYKMPLQEQYGVCLGLSEGKLHHVCFNMNDLLVWVYENDNLESNWVLKHCKPILEMHHPVLKSYSRGPLRHTDGHKRRNGLAQPFGFRDDILFMMVDWSMFTYNINTGDIEEELCSFSELENTASQSPLLLPFCMSLLKVQARG